MSGALRRGALLLAGGVVAQGLPAVTAIPALRGHFGRLDGRGTGPTVALTFDDGPHPRATPQLLDLLARHDVRATFFLIGERARRHPDLVARMAAAGHELGVHGWTHGMHLRHGYRGSRDQLVRTRDLLSSWGTPRFFRPARGVLTTGALMAARSAGLQPVLWTTTGHDWRSGATPQQVLTEVERGGLTGGATVLLHDSDHATPPEVWRATLAALPQLLARCHDRGLAVVPLSEHLGGGTAQSSRT